MPEFILDTSGCVGGPYSCHFMAYRRWTDLDAFTQGYIEALFFTAFDEPGIIYQPTPEGSTADPVPVDAGFSDLAPETLAAILRDCAAFMGANDQTIGLAMGATHGGREAEAGRDFWYTRNGHGCGFNDGDWPEPYAAQLTEGAKAFRETDAYLGDDGKVYLS